MSLQAGGRLGAFEILAPLGAGGMGEVWRARDPRLNREVAIKVLPEGFARDPDRLARFEREARVLAGLNHPGIAAIHGFEQKDGLRFLVLELVAGETLAERLHRGAIPMDLALRLTGQMAEALESAHARGVIHRDLKPANVKITPDGRAKLLDFGLAKELGLPVADGDPDNSPTLTRSPSAVGLIVGTAAFMSPEQARGQEVDRRTDIWALGCVLYEMLSGRRAFAGATTSDILAAVLTGEPDWDALPTATPPLLRSLLRRCLQKDPGRRWHDAADVRIAVEEVQAESSSAAGGKTPGATPRGQGRPLRWMIAGAALFLGGLGLGLLLRGRQPLSHSTGEPPRSFELVVGNDSVLDESYEDRGPALSPDGRYLAVPTMQADGTAILNVRDLSSASAEPLLQIVDGWDPFFSPDSASLGYYVHGDRRLKKISLKGRVEKALTEANDLRGGAWTSTGTIVFGDLRDPGLSSVPSEGGERRSVTQVPAEGSVLAHRWPTPLPGGRHVLFSVIGRSGRAEDNQVAAVDLTTGQVRVLVEGASQPRFARGYLLYVRGSALMGAPFDPERAEIRGPERRLLDQDVFAVPKTGAGYFDLAADGLLVYVPLREASPDRRLLEVDREGRVRPLTSAPRAYTGAAYSPDGSRLAVTVRSGVNAELWLFDRVSESWSRLLAAADITWPLWHPDGQRILLRSKNRQPPELLLLRADGSSAPEKVLEHPGLRETMAFSPDGSLIVNLDGPRTEVDVFTLDLARSRQLRPFLQTPSLEVGLAVSPDGRWIAYFTRESGRGEIFVRPLAGPGIARALGEGLRDSTFGVFWPSRGQEIFVGQGTSILAAAFDLRTGQLKGPFRSAFRVGTAATFGASVDVSPDGRKAVYVDEDPSARGLRVVAVPGFRPDEAPRAAGAVP